MKIYNLIFLLPFLYPLASLNTNALQKQYTIKPGASNIVLRSADGGQTWQDISEGLPGNLEPVGFVEKDNAVYIHSGNGIFRSKPNSTAPFWEKETFPDNNTDIAPGGSGKFVESNGVLLATSQRGIIRSTDAGQNWEPVISEGGVGIAIEKIEGGFAAITYNTTSQTRRVRTSYDGGKTWQAIDAGLPATPSIASIIQVGQYLFCGHPAGIFRSADKGKTWKLLVPSPGKKVFNLFVSDNVIYAIPKNGGC